MTAAPTLSIVVPVYNRAGTVLPTLQSVTQQTFTDFECLVVDDGSDDAQDLRQVVEALGDSRFCYVRQPNAGANAARNHGIDLARGRYVAMLDSDDTFLPHHLQAMVDAFARWPQDAIYATIRVDRGGGRVFCKPPRPIASDEHMALYLLCDRGFVQTSTLALPTDLARRVRYSDGLPFGQDTDFAIRLFNAGTKFRMLKPPSAVWLDLADPSRVSSRRSAAARQAWLNSIAATIPRRAYLGDRGWFVAKCHAHEGRLGTALALYFEALVNGAYRPRMAAIIALQILLSGPLYRRVTDTYLRVRSLFGRR